MIDAPVELPDGPPIPGLRARMFDPGRDYEPLVELIRPANAPTASSTSRRRMGFATTTTTAASTTLAVTWSSSRSTASSSGRPRRGSDP